jgi:hypothetical protein
MFQVILGCIHSTGHVDPSAGILGVLHEGKFPSLIRHSPILAHDNTQCKCRRTSKCNSDCRHSVYGIAGSKLSFINKGMRM